MAKAKKSDKSVSDIPGLSLLDRLRETDKKGLFTPSCTSVSYPTGFATFDYKNGYNVTVMDDDENVLDMYPSIGIRGGTFVTVVGKSSTAKSTFLIQSAYNMVKDIDNAFVIHIDLEQSTSYTRVKAVTKATQIKLKEKYIIRQEKNYIEDIYDMIIEIAKKKELYREEYTYDTGLLDEFGNKITYYVPNVIIIDSIPTLASIEASDAIEGGTYSNRVAKVIAQFYKRLMPIIKQYNITVVAVNHLNVKMEMNAFQKTQAQVMYMKQDEAMPKKLGVILVIVYSAYSLISGKSCIR